MFKSTLWAVLAIGLTVGFTGRPALASEPANLSYHKQELRVYVDSGEYAQSVAAVALSANKYVARRIARGQAKGEKLAIVFDIDETTLSNLAHIVQIVYDTAVRAKIDVFFITGRREADRRATEKNLREVGYDTWTKIFYKPETDIMLTTAGFKTDVRRKLTKEGYVIIANIGDQDSDLTGGYAERVFKLPNPFYLVK